MSKKNKKGSSKAKSSHGRVSLRDVVNLKTLLPTTLKLMFIESGTYGDIFWPKEITYKGNGMLSNDNVINDNVRYAVGNICRRLFQGLYPTIFIAGQRSSAVPVFKTTLPSHSRQQQLIQILACIGNDCINNRKFISKEAYVNSLCRRGNFKVQEVNDCMLAYAIIDYLSYALSQIEQNKLEEDKAA